MWERHFGVKHAVSVNSLTSGLVAAIGAIGIEPGDEVIVSPWTMSASATTILHWNAIPVFADIEPETFCLDPESVERNITPYTKAILAWISPDTRSDGRATSIARAHNLRIISDTAQAPSAKYKGEYAGTLADIGGFSLNYHKHIHTGEGGVMVTNDDELADRMRLIRNHAEVVVEDKGVTNLINMIGHNFRLGEIESAIGIEQLKKLDAAVESRQRIARRMDKGSAISGAAHSGSEAGLYACLLHLFLDPRSGAIGVDRQRVFEALVAEGVPALGARYENLHLLPMYQKQIAYGSKGFPWTSDICHREVNYARGICPVAEDMNDRRFLALASAATLRG